MPRDCTAPLLIGFVMETPLAVSNSDGTYDLYVRTEVKTIAVISNISLSRARKICQRANQKLLIEDFFDDDAFDLSATTPNVQSLFNRKAAMPDTFPKES